MGQIGLINLPSAETNTEQSIFFTFTRNNSYTKLGTLTITPFDWLEASYFYYRPDDLLWGSAQGLYLDKGFNLKVSHQPKNHLLPRFALGMDDFAGTGQFTKEYILATYDFRRLKLTSGLGWGKFVGENSIISNPLGAIDEQFNTRPSSSSNFGRGGRPAYDKWFRGDVTYFGGIEIPIGNKKNYSIKIESNPFDYFKFGCCGEGLSNDSFNLRKNKSDINYGISFRLKEFGNIDISYIKGDTFNISLSVGFSSKKPLRKKDKFQPIIKNSNYQSDKKNEFYLDLLENLNRNNLYLQTADLNDTTLRVTIDSEYLENPIQYTSRGAYIAQDVLNFNDYDDINSIDIGLITRGIQLNEISYKTSDLVNEKKLVTLIKEATNIKKVEPVKYKEDEFRPRVNFPIIYTKIDPEIRSHVGSPERFLYYGFGIKLSSEIQFTRNLTFNGSVGQSIQDNFDQKISDPNSALALVRTEIVDYLQASENLYIDNFQFDYIGPIKSNIYGRFSFGLLEQMYGGISSELMVKPFDSNFAVSIESNYVKKREYDGRFEFREYETDTYHINTSFYQPSNNFLLKVSYGKYLAGDIGYTLDLSRRMPSGWQAGFYFTRTNVSAAEFGEGSFDKGFYFKVPFNVFQKGYSKNAVNFSLKTMTRDGGQKLVIRNKLIDSFYGTSLVEINENWHNFLD